MTQQYTVFRPIPDTGSTIFGDIDEITFDADLQVSPTDGGKLTKYPVEKGGFGSDHFEFEPTKLSLKAVITCTPRSNVAEGYATRDIDIYEALLALIGKRVAVATSTRSYPSMVLLSVKNPRNAKSGHKMTFDLTFEEVRTTSFTLVQLPPRSRKRGGKSAAEIAANSINATAAGVLAGTASQNAAANAAAQAEKNRDQSTLFKRANR